MEGGFLNQENRDALYCSSRTKKKGTNEDEMTRSKYNHGNWEPRIVNHLNQLKLIRRYRKWHIISRGSTAQNARQIKAYRKIHMTIHS